MARIPVHLQLDDCAVDYIDVEPYGTIRVYGWGVNDCLPRCEVKTRDGIRQPDVTYRFIREDVCIALGVEQPFAGVLIEFRVHGAAVQGVVIADHVFPVPAEAAALLNAEAPAYAELLDTDRVLHRDDIYAEGRPMDTVDPEVLKFASLLKPPILDFGCGSGALVRACRDAGIEASGIEIGRPAILESIRPDVAPFIKLYDGTFPLPFTDGEFESVIATEVIEHVPDYRGALSDIARVCRSTFAITVPDISCIPIGAQRGFLPWHILEGTHVNFFNHRSLAAALSPHFRSIQLFQIARADLEGQFMPGGIAALATK